MTATVGTGPGQCQEPGTPVGSPVGSHLLLSRHNSRKLDRRQRYLDFNHTQIWATAVTSHGSLTCCVTVLSPFNLIALFYKSNSYLLQAEEKKKAGVTSPAVMYVGMH